MVSAWRNFKDIFSRPLFTIIFRPEFHFDPGNNVWICHILCVKQLKQNSNEKSELKKYVTDQNFKSITRCDWLTGEEFLGSYFKDLNFDFVFRKLC